VKLLDIKAVADKLGVSVRSVERLKARGELPPHRLVLGAHRWLESEVDAHIAALPRFDRTRKREAVRS
jgi:predicted DNA-binding transcriptional regulator AlpA